MKQRFSLPSIEEYHVRATQKLNKWLKEHMVEGQEFGEGIGYYDNYAVYVLKDSTYIWIESKWEGSILNYKLHRIEKQKIEAYPEPPSSAFQMSGGIYGK